MADLYDELTATWLKEKYLLGVDLTLDDGSAYPDSIYDHALRSAVAHIEHDLGISINTVPIKNEQHDAIDQNRLAWWPFRLDFRPVQTVTKLNIQYGSFAPVDIPVSWVQLVSPIHGQIHLIPSEEQLGSYMFRAGIPLISGDIFQPASYVPGYFRFDYTTGFEFAEGTVTLPSGATEVAVLFASDVSVASYSTTVTYTDQQGGGALFTSVKTHSGFTIKAASAPTAAATISWKISTVEEDLKAAIGMVAALLPLDVAGDLIAGAGIATISTSMDSLSQSLGTTSSATNCLTSDTRIVLADGTRPTIKELVGVKEFEVACVDEDGNQIVGTGRDARETLFEDVWEVRLSNSEVVRCSEDHPFRLLDGVYAPAKDLRSGMSLTPCHLAVDDRHLFVVSAYSTKEKEQLYDITVDTHHNFGIGQGVIVHNSGYGARVLQLERQLKSFMPSLRAKYKQIQLAAI